MGGTFKLTLVVSPKKMGVVTGSPKSQVLPIKMKYLIALAVLFFVQNVTAVEVEQQREGKFLSMFNIVRFPNDHCDAGGSRNGTCYTKEECSNKGGTEDGSCASGYGVCCTFVVNCGVSISENNTYFESDGDEKSHCSINVCKASEKIVQLRLDFITFNIAGPESGTTSVGKMIDGHLDLTTAQGMVSGLNTRCLTDIFSISNPGGPSPPKICGYNADTHMYVDLCEDCIDLTFQLGTSTLDPTWNIRITQYEMNYENLAPFGCTQYFWKEDSDSDGKGVITSYNWNGGNGYHLADQNQNICIRREEDKTQICYSVTNPLTDFSISGTQYDNAITWCGGYKGSDDGGTQRDALIIQSLSVKDNGNALSYSNVCGQCGFATGAAAACDAAGIGAAGKTKTLCTKSVPFVVRFTSDSWEGQDGVKETGAQGAGNSNRGFRINYEQF